ncbi:MAG TPA: DUF885 domain-containing protein [Thermoanaerobaculia bacterium]
MTELSVIADDLWRYWLERTIELRRKFGLTIEHLPDITFAAVEREAAFARAILQRLDAVQPGDDDERLTAAIIRWHCELSIEELSLFWYRFPVTPYRTAFFVIHNALPGAQAALAEMPRFVDDVLGVLREQERRGILIPKDEIPTVRALLGNLAQSLSPEIARLLAHFDDEYAARAPDGVGLWQYPGGAEAYRMLIRQETTLDLTPEKIHEIGVREIERIENELGEISDDPGFRHFLKTDERFFAKTPEEFAARLMAPVQRIEAQVPRFFLRTPKAPYGVKRLPEEFEDGDTFGYYQCPTAAEPQGSYYFNGSKLSERTLLWSAALIAHELIPGHHFQIARQEENESLPMIRRETSPTAFGEGWGEYASWLAGEMGAYADPYDRAGRLMQDAMLSARLVVDTGMNALGWSRQRAMDYMREHTMLSDTEIATETLRYAVDIPAQALAYKIGSLKMIELRALAKDYDVRQFHEWVIGSGALPLPLLEEHVRRAMGAHAVRPYR